jgi:hypothetical protein
LGIWDKVKSAAGDVVEAGRDAAPYVASRAVENLQAGVALGGNAIGAATDVYDAFAEVGLKPVSAVVGGGVDVLSQAAGKVEDVAEVATQSVKAGVANAVSDVSGASAATLESAAFPLGGIVPGVGGWLDRGAARLRNLEQDAEVVRRQAQLDADDAKYRASQPLRGGVDLEPVDVSEFASDLRDAFKLRAGREKEILSDYGRKKASDKAAYADARSSTDRSGAAGDEYGRQLASEKGVQPTFEEAINVVAASLGLLPAKGTLMKGAREVTPLIADAADGAASKAKGVAAAATSRLGGSAKKSSGRAAARRRRRAKKR